MTAVRLIARLDVKGPNLIKGICLEGHRVLGTPEDFAAIYEAEGADEILYVDAVASLYRRPPDCDVIRRVADRLAIPLTVVGGIRSVEDIRRVLTSGADKVGINTAAIAEPDLLRRAADQFGAQCIVCSIEAFRHADGRYEAWTDYGRERTGVEVFGWARQAVQLGVGEILVTSVGREGTGRGFDLDLTRRIATEASVPVVAAGGAGKPADFCSVIREGAADAVAAASVFHYRYARPVSRSWMSYEEPGLRMGRDIDSGNIEFLNHGYGGDRSIPVTPLTIQEVKAAMAGDGIPVRPALSENPS